MVTRTQEPSTTTYGHTVWNLYFLVNACTLACEPEFVYYQVHFYVGISYLVIPSVSSYQDVNLPFQLHGFISFAVKDRLRVYSILSLKISYFLGGLIRSATGSPEKPPTSWFNSVSLISSFANDLKFKVFMTFQIRGSTSVCCLFSNVNSRNHPNVTRKSELFFKYYLSTLV